MPIIDQNALQASTAKTVQAMEDAHYALLNANLALRGLNEKTSGYSTQVDRIDAAVLVLMQGKWLYGRATGELADYALKTRSVSELEQAQDCFDEVVALVSRDADPQLDVDIAQNIIGKAIRRHDTEILYYENTPILPNYCPVVLLVGSSRVMGRQYAMQCIEIFGSFVFETIAEKSLSKKDTETIGAWKQCLANYTPEIIDMAEGLAEGARLSGINMSSDQALSIWTGTREPALAPESIGVLDAEGGGVMGAYFGDTTGENILSDFAEGLCSAAAAWGRATRDNDLHYGSSTDHDCTFQVTMVAYPDEGNAFIYTPFSVNGSVPGVGRFGFAGHPGFNVSGLAYIHHAGGGCYAEAQTDWGYGVPRGASTLHLLRFANSTQEALEWELNDPIGDVGRTLGHSGGFYADAKSGYVLESRHSDAPIYREHTKTSSGLDQDFLYATNNVLSPNLKSEIFPAGGNSQWGLKEGWTYTGPMNFDTPNAGVLVRRYWAESAASRNRYLCDALSLKNGDLNFSHMLSLFRRGPEFKEKTWAKAEAWMNAGHAIESPSVGHRLNAFVGIASIDTRRYAAAIGPVAHRSVCPNRPGHGYSYYDEAHTYWELVLEDDPQSMFGKAFSEACILYRNAEKHMADAHLPDDGSKRLTRFLEEAKQSLEQVVLLPETLNTDAEIASLARAIRQCCRAQVRARQVVEVFVPPVEWNIE